MDVPDDDMLRIMDRTHSWDMGTIDHMIMFMTIMGYIL